MTQSAHVALRRSVGLRQCVGCGRSDAQTRLVRFGLRDGRVAWDRDRRLPGRGAYLHLDRECLDRFARRKSPLRALRLSVPAEERCRLVNETKALFAS